MSMPSADHSGMGFYAKDGSTLNWNGVNSFAANGFTTESDATYSPVKSGVTYHWVAFDEDGSSLATSVYGAAYSTDYTDGDVINIGFEPDFVLIVNKDATSTPTWRTKSVASGTDKSFSFGAAAGSADKIQAFSSSPSGFEIGGDAAVGTDWTAYTYMAFTGGSILPVELIKFEASKKDEGVLLEWETAVEINSDYFEILRSKDMKEFEVIGTKRAAGSSTSNLKYDFYDYTPVESTVYYKLREFDFDGETQESNIKLVKPDGGINLNYQLFPNPVSDKAILYFSSIESDVYNLTVNASNGEQVYQATLLAPEGENTFNLEMMDYIPGTYIVSVTNSHGYKFSMTILKK